MTKQSNEWLAKNAGKSHPMHGLSKPCKWQEHGYCFLCMGVEESCPTKKEQTK